ncbi:hypothetical protein Zmor_026506 [Zophobas morio]|uniref:Gustatory receptor n=1 Tax=Zophobas morio TaxID=2755281 RepID=A0AA38HUG7_9CUCU|nr:hypothetical protein Zmor_026506 [Zophobas morio]
MSPQLLQSTSKLVKYVYSVLGIVQFTYDKAPPKTKFAKVVPRLWCLLSYVYFINICIWYNNSKHDGKIMTYVQFFVDQGSVFMMIVLFIMLFKRSNKIKMLLICIDDLNLSLNCPATTRKRALIRITLVVSVLPLIIFSSFQEERDFYHIFWYYCCVVITFDTIFFNDIFDCIGDKFAAANEKLEIITKRDKSYIHVLQNFSHFHYDLVRLTLEIKNQFEITTIASMIHSFICMVDAIYTITVLVAHSRHLTLRFGANFSYLVFSLYHLCVLIAKISQTQELANIGVLHLHEIWNKHVSKKEMNKEFRHLELLSIRMLNTQMEFNIRGFFNLDWTFFQSMVVAFTTYWLILVQFQI